MARRLPDGTKVKGGRGVSDARTRVPRASARGSGGTSDTDTDRPTLQLIWNNTSAQARTAPQDAIREWAKRAKRQQKRSGGVQRQKVLDELDSMLSSGEWGEARPVHLVELYCMLHERVYGVEALDLRGQLNRQAAARMVLTMLQRDFDSVVADVVEFMRWSWQREEAREEWRRRNNTGRRRLTWRMQFGGELLTEYLMQRVRNG